MSERHWKTQLPFENYTGGNFYTMGNYMEITYFAYLRPWQIKPHPIESNHMDFTVSLSSCFAHYLNCYIPQKDSGHVEYGIHDVNNMQPIISMRVLMTDFLHSPFVNETVYEKFFSMYSDTVDSFRYLSTENIVMTNIYLKRGKVCVTILKYPRLIPGEERLCGYTLVRDIPSSFEYTSRELIKHHGHNCVKVEDDTKTVRVQQILGGSYGLFDVNSFVVRGQCVFGHTLESMGYTNNPLSANTSAYIGNYWLQDLNHIFSSMDGFGNGFTTVAHYTIPALITAVALANMDRKIKELELPGGIGDKFKFTKD